MEIVSVENGVRRTMEETGGGEEDLDLDVDSLTTTVGRKKRERERKERGRRGKRWKRRGRGGEMQAGKQADGKLFWNEVFFEAGFYAR